jgi:F-type H+-transporting ATPase subunit a
MPFYIAWAPNVLWKAFGGAIAVIQAFIFALLTVLYFAMAGARHGVEHHDGDDDLNDQAGHDEAVSAERTPVPAA